MCRTAHRLCNKLGLFVGAPSKYFGIPTKNVILYSPRNQCSVRNVDAFSIGTTIIYVLSYAEKGSESYFRLNVIFFANVTHRLFNRQAKRKSKTEKNVSTEIYLHYIVSAVHWRHCH